MMRRPIGLSVVVVVTIAAAAAQKSAAEDTQGNVAASELFLRAFAVFSHPRCSNCHPRDDQPRQGTSMRHVHAMNVQRGREKTVGDGAGGYGRPGMECRTCHEASNGTLPGSPPGALNWRLAPKEMGWDGLTASELCTHFNDLAARGVPVMDHIVKPDDKANAEWKIDPLVKWAWEPGLDRDFPPVSLPEFTDLLRGWKKAGSGCPPK
jgi:hypothetical protein